MYTKLENANFRQQQLIGAKIDTWVKLLKSRSSIQLGDLYIDVLRFLRYYFKNFNVQDHSRRRNSVIILSNCTI